MTTCLWRKTFQDHDLREEVLTDELWARVELLIPVRPRHFHHPDRRRVNDRAAGEILAITNDLLLVKTAGDEEDAFLALYRMNS